MKLDPPGHETELGAAYDLTAHIGQLGQRGSAFEWPMYSFAEPAYRFWNGVAAELHKAGWAEGEIKGYLQSKAPRWLLDHDRRIDDLAATIGKELVAQLRA